MLAKSAKQIGADEPILIPASRFIIKVESARSFGGFLLQCFLICYGDQVTHLEIHREELAYTKNELKFYECFPNLNCLSLKQWGVRPAQEPPQVPFPQVFRELKRLEMDFETPLFSVWRILELCNQIQSFRHPPNIGNLHHDEFTRLLRTLRQGNYQNLKLLDMLHFSACGFGLGQDRPRQLIFELDALVRNRDMKLANVTPHIFRELDDQLDQFGPRILSLANFDIGDAFLAEITNGIGLPNVKKLRFHVSCRAFRADLSSAPTKAIIARNLPALSVEKMPSVRKLEIKIRDWDAKSGGSRLLAGIWGGFPNIVELKLLQNASLADVDFIGENGELPFLQLTSK